MPISTGLIRYRAAKPIATGATIATVAGVAAPMPAITAQITNIAHGTSATRPRTARTLACTIQSTVPLFFASANRYVTPTRMTNRFAGKPATTSSGPTPKTVTPTTPAAARASAPMLTDRTVATRKTRTRTARAMTSCMVSSFARFSGLASWPMGHSSIP